MSKTDRYKPSTKRRPQMVDKYKARHPKKYTDPIEDLDKHIEYELDFCKEIVDAKD